MRYIETDFPLEDLERITQKEGTPALKHPLHSIHKWWARRPNSVFRMIILATFLKSGVGSKELWEKFYQATLLNNELDTSPIILDPFVGGGTTLVEGLQLNARVIGVDINPVAWFVSKKTIDTICFEQLNRELNQLKKQANDFKTFYQTQCPLCEKDSAVMYFFWVRQVKCTNCNELIPLYPNFLISTRRKKTNFVFCPQCNHVFEPKSSIKNQISCEQCKYSFYPLKGYVKRGRFICPSCQHQDSVLQAAQKQNTILELTMYAIEYSCNVDGRHYKRPDKSDIVRFKKAASIFNTQKDNLPYPRQKIPDGFNYKQATNYGYEYFHQMFNKRQLLVLTTILQSILQIQNENTREFLLLAFSDSLQYNNMFVRYHRSNSKVESMFAQHAYWPPTTTVENNPWGTHGKNKTPQAGSFYKSVNKLLVAKRFCLNPYLLQVENTGKTNKIVLPDVKIEGHRVQKFHELYNHEQSVLLKCQTSEKLDFIPDQSVDAVITDPPYFDNVMYSEVSDFFYVWLRIGLRDQYPIFSPSIVSRNHEIIVNPSKNSKKDSNFYFLGLTNVFREIYRVLKEDGFFTFTFHHKKLSAWTAVLSSLLISEFVIVSVYPIHTEMPSSLHIRGKDAGHFDTVITAKKKKNGNQMITWEQLQQQITRKVENLLERVRKTHGKLTNVDHTSIVLGQCVKLYSQYYPKIFQNNEQIKLSDAIQKMESLIEKLANRR